MYDVFLSFSGVDRSSGRELAEELRVTHGLRVFFDEHSIETFSGINDTILDGLRCSRSLVAYYSEKYAARVACRHELMMAFLAGQREGDGCKRIMVINPEQTEEHLRPIELADAKYALPGTDVQALAQLVAKRAASLEGTIGATAPSFPGKWPVHRSKHLKNFAGRYRELWDLHSALHATGFPLQADTIGSPAAAVSGLPGAGKTALATAYAWRFAAAFPGGVEWLSLAGAPDATPHERYLGELRRIAQARKLHDVPDADLVERLCDNEQSSLWIIDDIPPDAGTDVLELLPLPTGTHTRTILISEVDQFRDTLPVVRVGPLPAEDATTLLDVYREPDDDQDRAARDHLIRRLGHNAGALTAMGDYLRDRQGLSSYVSFEDELAALPEVAEAVFAHVHPVLDHMTTIESLLLRVANESGTTLPAAALRKELPDISPSELGNALKSLLHRFVASREGTEWRLDPYVVHAASTPRSCSGDVVRRTSQPLTAIHSFAVLAHRLRAARSLR